MTLLRYLLGWRDPPPPAVPVESPTALVVSHDPVPPADSLTRTLPLAVRDLTVSGHMVTIAEYGGASYPAPLVLPPVPRLPPVVPADEVYDPCWRTGT